MRSLLWFWRGPAIQTEQSITVSGYGAMTVNNEPASVPEGFPAMGQRLLVFFLGHDPAYTPHGLHKYEWDPVDRELREAHRLYTEIGATGHAERVGRELEEFIS